MNQSPENKNHQWSASALAALIYEICFLTHQRLGSKSTLVQATVNATLAGLFAKVAGHTENVSQLGVFVEVFKRLHPEMHDEDVALVSMAAFKRIHTLANLEAAHPALELTKAKVAYLSNPSAVGLEHTVLNAIKTAQAETEFWAQVEHSMRQHA